MSTNPLPFRSAYDEIAGMYHALWADWFLPAAVPALERLFFSQVVPGACVLDLCCGSGHVTKELVARGYAVTGVDSSAALIAEARKALPQAEFHVQDVRALSLPHRYDAVLSTFDSLNHILRLEDLQTVFTGVHRHLKPGGLFVFDMNDEEAYSLDLHRWTANVGENEVGLVRGLYDPVSKIAQTELVWFQQMPASDLWERKRSVVEQRCYRREEVLEALTESGFRNPQAAWAAELGMTADLGFGRVFYAALA